MSCIFLPDPYNKKYSCFRKGSAVLKGSNHLLPRKELPLWGALLAAVLLSGAVTLLCLWIQPNSLRAVLRIFRAQPLLVVLNALPIGLVILGLSFLLRNVFAAAGIAAAACALLSAANRIKLEVRDEPVFPRDFALLKEVGSAMGAYSIRWPWGILAVILGITALLLLLGRIFRLRPFARSRKIDWAVRLAGLAGSLLCLVSLTLTVYASNDLYNAFQVSNAYYVPSVFNELGFPYCFMHQFTTYTVDKPQGYSRAQAESWETGNAPGQGRPVHVIMVMNEAFSDLSDSDAFAYSAADDPLPNLHALQQDTHCISGHVVVPGFAGGTANTEFDVLTGMQTNALSATTTSAFRAVNRNLDSVLRVFDGDGYHTAFYHPGDAWFYNRENVYRWLGAQETEFAEDMDALAYKGRWVTDAYMADYIEQKFARALEEGQLLCSYTTTIQNHMSYTADKYGADHTYADVPLQVDVSDSARSMLQVYLEGARDADAMLGRLRDFFAGQTEPVVLVFWGDHLPYLGDNQQVYRELGSDVAAEEDARADRFSPYETPYIIWANDAAAQALNWTETVAALDLPEDGDLSACYLGSLILELTGRRTESLWFSYLSQLRRQLPVIQRADCRTASGATVKIDTLPQEQQDLISKLRCWSYYKLKVKDVNG